MKAKKKVWGIWDRRKKEWWLTSLGDRPKDLKWWLEFVPDNSRYLIAQCELSKPLLKKGCK